MTGEIFMIKPPLLPAILFFLALAFIPTQAQGQNLSEAWMFTPKSGSGTGFQEAFRSHMEFRQVQGDTWNWSMWEVVTGENVGDFMVISMDHEWADFDTYQDSDFAEVAGPHWGATVGPLVEKVSSVILQGDTTFAKLPTDPGYEVNLVNLMTFHLIPGKMMAFNQALAQIHQAMVGADMPVYYMGSMPVIGGEGDSYNVAILGETWADFADPDPNMMEAMVETYGEEEAMAIFTSFGESYHTSESVMLRFREDLSILPEM
jgi:hypothetical protein